MRALTLRTPDRSEARRKNEDENCTSSFSSSTIPLTSELRRHLNCCFQLIYLYHTRNPDRKSLVVRLSARHF